MKNIHTTRRVCCFMEIWKERESERIARIAMDYDHDGYGNANNRPLSCLCMQQIPKTNTRISCSTHAALRTDGTREHVQLKTRTTIQKLTGESGKETAYGTEIATRAKGTKWNKDWASENERETTINHDLKIK